MGLTIRVIIVVPLIFIFWVLGGMFWNIIDPVNEQVQGSQALADLGWFGSVDTVLFIGVIGMPLLALALLVWMVWAPLKEDNVPRRGI